MTKLIETMKEILTCAILASVMAAGFIYALDKDTVVQQNKMEAYWSETLPH